MNYLPSKKQTFLKESGPVGAPAKKHLFCILTDVIDHNHYVVPICSFIPERKYNDETCLLQAGDHSFITHPSYVAYKFITHYHTTTISTCIEAGTFIKREDFQSVVFKRIYNGIPASKHTPEWARKAHQSWPKN